MDLEIGSYYLMWDIMSAVVLKDNECNQWGFCSILSEIQTRNNQNRNYYQSLNRDVGWNIYFSVISKCKKMHYHYRRRVLLCHSVTHPTLSLRFPCVWRNASNSFVRQDKECLQQKPTSLFKFEDLMMKTKRKCVNATVQRRSSLQASFGLLRS
jgi:hypothetical protein